MKKGWTDIQISKLVKANWNYKEENEKQTDKLLNNFKRNGQIENILIRELDTGFYEVVNGNHRLDVMKILKLKKAHAYNFGKISLAEAQRIAIETNETKFYKTLNHITNEYGISRSNIYLMCKNPDVERRKYNNLNIEKVHIHYLVVEQGLDPNTIH